MIASTNACLNDSDNPEASITAVWREIANWPEYVSLEIGGQISLYLEAGQLDRLIAVLTEARAQRPAKEQP